MFNDCKQLKKLVLNEGLRKIGINSFCYCRELEQINLPSTITEIDQSAFYGCSRLKKVVLNEGLKKLGINAFRGCRSLKNITFPSTVIEAGGAAFNDCNNLNTVILNEALQTIGASAFGSCSLESITIPSTLTEISVNTFYNCQNLSEVGLHEGIQKIGQGAFRSCPSMERFAFPFLSTRLDNIIRIGQTEVEDKIDAIIRGLVERRGSELFVSASPTGEERINTGFNWEIAKEVLRRIDRLITYYELREATTLLELAMWKSKIDHAETEDKPINLDSYRIDIPGPVKNTILQYLNFRV